MPMPMSAASLHGALDYGASRHSPYHAHVRCHRCWREEEAGEKYCALAEVMGDSEILHLECISCLVLAAVDEGVVPARVTNFVDNHCMGCMQACSMLQGFASGGVYHG